MADSKEEEDRKRKITASKLYKDIKETQWPIIYSPEYNISFLGLEKLHPFDAGKWGRVYEFLKEGKMIRDDTTVRADEAQADDLMVVHPKRYIDSLKLADFVEGINNINEWSVNVAGITEVAPVALLPNFIVQRKVLKPFRFQTGGTILAAKLAYERGWGINIGGGFHHCCANRGGGFCAYADITLAIKFLMATHPEVKKVMIVDLDAHQGNGHERDFMDEERVYIMDVYNRNIYPHDGFAKRAIKRKVELQFYTEDEEYLRLVRINLEGALNEFEPDFVVYNAGTDILEGDPLGCLSISAQGIVDRDQIVFQKARTRGIPVMMVTSGGYQKSTARIIADSILNLRALSLITCDAAEDAPLPPELLPPTNLPRSTSEGGLWAKFKNCANMTRSSTSENLAQQAGTSPSSQTKYSPNLRSRSANMSPCMARSKTHEDMKQFENMEDEEFLEETLDFKAMLEEAAHARQGYEAKVETKDGIMSGVENKTCCGTVTSDVIPDIRVTHEQEGEADSSPYDSDDTEGCDEIDQVQNIVDDNYPSYADVRKEKCTDRGEDEKIQSMEGAL